MTFSNSPSNPVLVRTKYGDYYLPQTSWVALRPFYPEIISAIIEVVLENDINLSIVTKKDKTGFVAPGAFWQKHIRNKRYYKLKHARFFISKLKEKEKFIKSISVFNKNAKVNWLEDDNYPILGGYLYSFCFYILDDLIKIKKNQKKT